tara:strand:- start:45 stop:488 length:444 start_codon:yes stop_codon:yes gene_type:complete
MANPMYGQNKSDALIEDVKRVKVRKIMLDFGAQAAGTDAISSFNKGDVILGFSATMTEAMTSGGNATIQLGFTGASMLTAAIAKGSASLGAVLAPVDKGMLVLAADDTFDSIVGTAAATAGKCDIEIWYIENGAALSSDEYAEVVTA